MNPYVLIAEDNPELRDIMSQIFTLQSCTVKSTANGEEAIQIINHCLPDVAVLDIHMPKISGLQVLQHIRQHQGSKNVTVIMVTGNYFVQHGDEARQADLFLVKPVDIDKLIEIAVCLNK